MLDVDYLGESSPDTWYLAASRPTGTWSETARYGSIFAVHDAVVSETFVYPRSPIPPYGRRLKGL
eukprot:6212151-Pleurochrysis_carterae.AAC.1